MPSEVAPSNLGLAEKALQEELARSLNEGFTAAEVEKFKQIMIADRLRARSGDAYAMSFVAYEMEFDNPKDRREKHDALIAALTPEEVNAVWRKFVKPEQLVWGIFGDQSKIKW